MRYSNRSLSEGNTFLYLFLCFFPLFVWTNYSTITNMKMVCFLVLLIGFGVMTAIALIKQTKKVRQYPLAWGNYTPDFILLFFLFTTLISGLISPYLGLTNKSGQSLIFIGAGRHDGWLFLLAYAALFFLVTRFCHFKRAHLQGFAIVTCIMSFIGVVQLCGINFLNLYPPSKYKGFPDLFFSTIGNADVMGGFLCMAVPVVGVGYVVFRLTKGMRAFFLVAHTLSIYLMIYLEVDMAIVGLMALVAVMTPLLLRNRVYTKRVLDIGMSIALGIGFTGFVHHDYVQKELKTYTTFKAEKLFLLCLAVFAVFLVLRLVWEYVKMPRLSYKALRWVVFGVEVAAVVAAFCYLRFMLEQPNKEGLMKDLYELVRGHLSITAGHHRAGIWKYSMEMASHNPVFGTGSGTFATTFKAYAKEVGYTRYYNRNLDFAHNEYINYYCSFGIMGVGSYLAFLISVAWQAVKRCAKNPKILVLGSAVLGYSVQVFFCFSVVIVAPLFWLFLGLLVGEIRATMAGEKVESAKISMLEMDSAE